MAETLQRVFLIFVRPYYMSGSHKAFYKGTIEASFGTSDPVLLSGNNSGTAYSDDFINSEGVYDSDVWFLHSSYVSYDTLRAELKNLLKEYGTSNIRATKYIPIDFEVLPNE